MADVEGRKQINSPRISKIEWGKMSVDGYGNGKDFKIYPGGAEEWDWTKTNTKHNPGIQPQDVKDLLDHGAHVIVLSKGMDEVLQTSKETIDLFNEQDMKLGVDYFMEETREAVKRHNDLVESGILVGSLIHSTC